MDELEQGQSSMPPPPKPGTQSMPSASSMAALQSASSDPDGLLWLTGVLVFLSSLFAFLQNTDQGFDFALGAAMFPAVVPVVVFLVTNHLATRRTAIFLTFGVAGLLLLMPLLNVAAA